MHTTSCDICNKEINKGNSLKPLETILGKAGWFSSPLFSNFHVCSTCLVKHILQETSTILPVEDFLKGSTVQLVSSVGEVLSEESKASFTLELKEPVHLKIVDTKRVIKLLVQVKAGDFKYTVQVFPTGE